MMKYFAMLSLVLACLLSGCYTAVERQNFAVERARKFVIEKAGDLTPEEVFYVKYNEPILLTSYIIGSKSLGGKETVSSELLQICVAWKLPERKEALMVYGASVKTMEYWYPNRLIRKNWSETSSNYFVGILSRARDYATNYLWTELDAKEYNVVRYGYPWTLQTDIDINFDYDGKQTAEEIAKRKKELKGKTQYSLVWDIGKDRKLVVTGHGQEKMAGWGVEFAGFMTDAEVKQHTLSILRRPEEGEKMQTDEKMMEQLEEQAKKSQPTSSKEKK